MQARRVGCSRPACVVRENCYSLASRGKSVRDGFQYWVVQIAAGAHRYGHSRLEENSRGDRARAEAKEADRLVTASPVPATTLRGLLARKERDGRKAVR